MTAYRSDIDGLRAIAVGGVVLFHAFPTALSGGFIGVDVFFVLSGFLITSIIKAQADKGTFSIANFYERRFRRILPALVVVATATTVAAILVLPPTELKSYGNSLVGVATFSSNIVFWFNSGYFDAASADKLLLHTWSLAVEEQFYILWPLIVAALVKAGRKRWLGAFVWLAVVGSLLAAIWAVRAAPSQAFYLLPYRAWELGFGALLAVGAIPAFRQPWLRETGGVVGLALIVVPMALYDEQTPFPGLAAVPPCLGALLLIHAGQGYATMVGRALSIRPILFVGLVSYSFYLWHWPLLVLPRLALNRPLEPVEAATAIVAAFALAVWSLKYVERPFRAGGLPTMRRSRVLWASVGVGAAMTASGVSLVTSDGLYRFAPPDVIAAEAAVADINPLRRKCHASGDGQLGNMAACTVGRQDNIAGYDILLWGDSHADHLMPGLSRYARAGDFEVRQASVSGCSPLTLFVEYGSHSSRCPEVYKLALAEGGRQQDLDTVIVSSRWSGILPAIFENNSGHDKARALAIFETSLRSVIGLIRKSAPTAKILIVGSTPEFDLWPATCFARAAQLDGDEVACGRRTPTDTRWGPEADRVIAKLADGNVTVVLPRKYFCDGDICATRQGRSILFRDDDHLTTVGSLMVARDVLHAREKAASTTKTGPPSISAKTVAALRVSSGRG